MLIYGYLECPYSECNNYMLPSSLSLSALRDLEWLSHLFAQRTEGFLGITLDIQNPTFSF